MQKAALDTYSPMLQFGPMSKPLVGDLLQDMACETFLKICSKCKRKFVVQQVGRSLSFHVAIVAVTYRVTRRRI